MAKQLATLYRTAFVTGASTGLGRAFADMLLAEGVRVWGTARAAERLAPLVGERFTPVVLDLKDREGALAAFRAAERAAEGFDLVINNAGYGAFAEFTAVDFGVWEEQLRVMLVNTAALAHAALPPMIARGRGALVNISSLAAEFPLPFQSAYNIAKAGLSALNESLMLELAPTGVVVLDVRPGDYRTDFEGSVRRPQSEFTPRMERAWRAFEALMSSGPGPAHAAASLRRALWRRRSGTVRTGRFSQAVLAPFLARFGSLALKRRLQARYFNVR
ncbi:SDR family NAD(P)-dependent oxidoreductase [Horticoccus luteus]|uniref:SDR family NAD(P)-dependent oxidoreductase n=1 Tax=Horticoccus luteus TaxID=2862869 RepID=A0A8F9XME0_9BACT|nr:SDR family NAD(P)-dependent oxidoreductase [Horticoccus luteus]QYM79944.1 SDR family NAD(P)-dependent oxidoreductase [Horticoccus luteus]